MTGKRKEKGKCDEPEQDDDATWEKDQKKCEYYYDDAHGYETFDPAGKEEDEEE
jgi:hypothetical protein